MKKIISCSILALSILGSQPGMAAESKSITTHDQFNDLLKAVHKHYSNKDFSKVDEVRPRFLHLYEEYKSKVDSGKTKLSSRVQKADYKLAQNYYSSLTKYYEALKVKYNHVSKPETEESKVAVGSAGSSNEKEIGLLTKIMNAANLLQEDGEVSEDLLSQELQRDMGLTEEEISRIFEDPEIETVLSQEIPLPVDEKEWSDAFDKHYAYKHSIEGKSDALKSELVVAPAVAPNSTDTKATELDKKVAEVRSAKVDQIYKSESKLVKEGLDKIKILKENQARFEIKVLNESKSTDTAPKNGNKKSTQKPVYAMDRLEDNDEDVIMISLPPSRPEE